MYTTAGYSRSILLLMYITAGYTSSDIGLVYTATGYASNDIDLGSTIIGKIELTALGYRVVGYASSVHSSWVCYQWPLK